MLAGELALSHAAEALAPRVTLHMGRLRTATTPVGWSTWVRFMRETGRVEQLSARMERLEHHADGTTTAHGRWHGVRKGRPVRSGLCAPRYRVVEGRVVELWTSPQNYQLVFGPAVRTWLGFGWVVLRFRWWRRRQHG